VVGEDEEAVAAGLQTGRIFKMGNGLEPGVGSSVIEGEEVLVAVVAVSGAADDGESGLPAVVDEEEIPAGGAAAPVAADGAAAE
jgi:hypothetical protein